jgi:hypothetical protein
VYNALAMTPRLVSLRSMQFYNHFFKDYFYLEELCPSAFTGWLELWWAPFLPHLQLLPGIGSILILFVHSVEVVTCTHERSILCCTTGRTFPSILLFVWSPVDDPSQSPFFSATLQTHPFVSPSISYTAYADWLAHWSFRFTLWTIPNVDQLKPQCPLLCNMGRPTQMTLTIHHRSISQLVPPIL